MEAGRGRSEPRTLAPGWDPGAPLLAPTDLPMGKFFSPSRLSTNHPRCPQEGGWPLPVGKPMGTRGMNPQPCALGGHRNTEQHTGMKWSQHTVGTPPGSLQSHFPNGEKRQAACGLVVTRSLSGPEETPVPGHLPRGAGGHCVEEVESSCRVHVPRRPRENDLRCTEAQKVRTQNCPRLGGDGMGQTMSQLQ